MKTSASPATADHALALAARLPRLDEDSARRDRIGCDRRLGAWLAAQLGLRASRTTATAPGAGWRFRVRCGGGWVDLSVPEPLPAALQLACTLPEPELAAAVATQLLAPWAERLQATLGDLSVIGIEPAPASAQARPWIAGAVHLMGLDDLAAQHVDRALRDGVQASARSFASLRVPVAVRLFTQPMNPAALRSLARGDVVVAPGPFRLGGAWRTVIAFGGEPRMQAEAELDTAEARAQLVGAPAAVAATEPPLDALGELVLPVAFEIDRASVTLAELAALGEGSTLELDVPITQATVRLVCQGQTVGSGQLVAIGERLGVRIARMGLAGLGTIAGASGGTGHDAAA